MNRGGSHGKSFIEIRGAPENNLKVKMRFGDSTMNITFLRIVEKIERAYKSLLKRMDQ